MHHTLEVRQIPFGFEYRVKDSHSGRLLVDWQYAPSETAAIQQGWDRFNARPSKQAMKCKLELPLPDYSVCADDVVLWRGHFRPDPDLVSILAEHASRRGWNGTELELTYKGQFAGYLRPIL